MGSTQGSSVTCTHCEKILPPPLQQLSMKFTLRNRGTSRVLLCLTIIMMWPDSTISQWSTTALEERMERKDRWWTCQTGWRLTWTKWLIHDFTRMVRTTRTSLPRYTKGGRRINTQNISGVLTSCGAAPRNLQTLGWLEGVVIPGTSTCAKSSCITLGELQRTKYSSRIWLMRRGKEGRRSL